MTDTPIPPQWSLRRELTRVLLLVALLPAAIFGVALLWSQWQREYGDLQLRLASNANLSANAIGDFLQGELAGVRLVADAVAPARERDGAALVRLLRAYPSMLRAVETDRQGRVVAARSADGRALPVVAQLVVDRDWFTMPRDSEKPHVSDAYATSMFGNEPLVAVSAPIHRYGEFDGVVQASIPVERFTRVRSDNLRRRGYEFLVLDRQDRVIHASRGLRWSFAEGTGEAGAAIRALAARPGAKERIQRVEGLVAGGGAAYVGAVAMDTGWLVAVVAPAQRVLAPALPRLGLLLGLMLLTTLGVLFALWRMRRLLTASLGRLLVSLHGYALGGTLAPEQMSRMPEELQPLATGIGDLAARMNAAYAELRHVLDQREQVIADRTLELRSAVSDLDRLSRTDALTGSLNYRGFLEAGERLFREAGATGMPLSVLALDIDHFKRYNDLYGHAEGDGALRRFSGAVRSALQHADDVLARPGGEEFIVFLPGSTMAQAQGVAARILARVRDADILHAASPQGRMSASIGVASMQDGDREIEDVLLRADQALYRAKDAGRDCAMT